MQLLVEILFHSNIMVLLQQKQLNLITVEYSQTLLAQQLVILRIAHLMLK